jgi:phosphoenolpyruvate carboxykinase (ATP)
MESTILLEKQGISVARILRNPSPAKLYEEALRNERGTAISSAGALVAMSGKKTGRSPSDKRIVEHPGSKNDIWWGNVNIRLDEHVFDINRERAIDYLNTQERLFVVDGYAGWDERYRIKVRVICERAYHALFMHNMLIRPSAQELENFGEPDFVIINAGKFPANKHTSGMTSKTSIDLCFERGEFLILGSEYAGEMKKGVFTIMNYVMPKKNVLSMHCSANEGEKGDVTIFFGLSGTGKTTLSADPRRRLIGDDEHCWTDDGVFNIEGGCYAKVIDLSQEQEPDIWEAIRFGAVLENVVYDELSRTVDYRNVSITQNTRCAYPIEYIGNAKLPCMGGHPKNVIFLTADAFSVLPPVSRLTPGQAMYHFISGYTAKVAGTEVGVNEPEATFSSCFGQPFLVWHPMKYAGLLAEKMKKHNTKVWLVNTGWSGGQYGVGKRMSIAHTRAIIDAIHSGALDGAETQEDPVFGLQIPRSVPDVPERVLVPSKTWADRNAYQATAAKLAKLFNENFKRFADQCSDEVKKASPRL